MPQCVSEEPCATGLGDFGGRCTLRRGWCFGKICSRTGVDRFEEEGGQYVTHLLIP